MLITNNTCTMQKASLSWRMPAEFRCVCQICGKHASTLNSNAAVCNISHPTCMWTASEWGIHAIKVKKYAAYPAIQAGAVISADGTILPLHSNPWGGLLRCWLDLTSAFSTLNSLLILWTTVGTYPATGEVIVRLKTHNMLLVFL